MRSLRIFVIVLVTLVVPALSSAGAVKPEPQIVEGVLGLLFNNFLARGQEAETTAGKISFNVYCPNDNGEMELVDVWDGNDGRALAWTDDISLEPVVGINRIKGDPREVQYWIDSSRGNQTVFYAANKGGKRGKNGEATENSGYRDKIPLIRVRDLPQGKIFIGARWGNGSAIAEFVHIDVANTYKAVIENKRIRAALAGAGGAVFPPTPILTMIIDGKAEYFLNEEEIKSFMDKKNSSEKKEVPPPIDRTETAPPVEATERMSHPGVEVRCDFYVKDDVMGMGKTAEERLTFLRNAVSEASPVPPSNDQLHLSRTNGTAVLITSDEAFEVTLGNSPISVKRQGARYECLLTLKYDPNNKGSKLLVRQNGRTQTFSFKEVD